VRIRTSLFASSLLLAACGPNPSGGPDRYDISKMDLKPSPAQVSNERHTGTFAAGSSLSTTATLKPLDPAAVSFVALQRSVQKKLTPRGLALLPLRVMDRPGELKTAARP
jgi:hypothetical protein